MLSRSGCVSLAAGARRSERCSGGWGLTSGEQRYNRNIVGEKKGLISIRKIAMISRADSVDPG